MNHVLQHKISATSVSGRMSCLAPGYRRRKRNCIHTGRERPASPTLPAQGTPQGCFPVWAFASPHTHTVQILTSKFTWRCGQLSFPALHLFQSWLMLLDLTPKSVFMIHRPTCSPDGPTWHSPTPTTGNSTIPAWRDSFDLQEEEDTEGEHVRGVSVWG